MKLAALFLAFLCVSGLVCAQGDPPQDPQQDPEPRRPIIVTATRLAEDPFEVPFATERIDQEQIRRRAYRTMPQALRDVPGVMVQETAHGHGSPYIRGFTSFRTLLMIDGIRLNNSVFRPGPNQYWNTVDALSLDRIEVVKGPSSVLYGSDAIGGTVNVFTKSPDVYAEDGGFARGLNTYLRYSSAEDSIQGRVELNLGYTWEDGARTGVLLGGSIKDYGDLEGGRSVDIQRGTGYDENDFDIKIEHALDEDTKFSFLHQRVSQNDVPRTHRTVNGIDWRGLSVGSDLQRDFEQDRYLTYLQFARENIGAAVDSVHASISYQQQDEQRDRIRGNGNQEFQGFEVGTLGISAQLNSITALGNLSYGVEYYHDEVDSFLDRLGNGSPADSIQGPIADDATYDLLGVYLQDQIEIGEDLEIILGGRFNFAAADADSVRDPVTDTKISIDDDWSSLLGSVRFRYRLVDDHLNMFGGVSQGFRAPNLSDLSRFDSARSNEFEIPAPNLDPEEYLSYEIGFKVESEDLSLQTSYFYTDIEDQILRFPTGNTNAAGDSEVTKDNVGDGHVYGIELGAAWQFVEATTLFGNATYTEGRVTNFENSSATLSESYLTRLMPFTAQVGLRWEQPSGEFWAESVLVHAEEADKLSFSDRRDSSRIPGGGTPGYTIWHLRAGWQINESSSLDVLLENITDVDYRVHGSGLNRPGRNLVVGVATRF